MIAHSEGLAELFCILHDGVIASVGFESPELVLQVNILYLAERAVPGSTSFTVRFCAVEQLAFTPWGTEGAGPERPLTDPAEIAACELEILNAVTAGNAVQVNCLWPASLATGGELLLMAGGATVLDERDREWTLDSLRELARQYWHDWQERNRIGRRV